MDVIFIILVEWVLANNEKTFRDLGPGLVEILSHRLWDNQSIER